MRGQISLELLVTFGILVAFTVPILILMLTVSSHGYENSARLQANAVSKTLADSINELYTQGPGTKRSLSLAFPTNSDAVRIADNEVTVILKTSTGNYEAVSPLFARVRTQLITNKIGLTNVNLEVDGTGEVIITG